jgi:3-phenylpropionate/trans-cinnamate dioxygenase ferredoxin component
LAKGDGGLSWQKVASLSDIALGGIRSVLLHGEPVLVCRTEAGVYALADRCPHAGWPLSGGRIRGGSLVCPLHGARFALKDGAPLGGPAREPVKCYPVRVEGDDILILAEAV